MTRRLRGFHLAGIVVLILAGIAGFSGISGEKTEKAVHLVTAKGTSGNAVLQEEHEKSLPVILLASSKAKQKSADLSPAQKAARILTNPYVITLLLTVGIVGLLIEAFTPGFGIPGFIGITCLFLFFFSHIAAGFTGYESVLLFLAGLLLIVVEFFVPGGIIGLLGLGAVLYSFFLAANNLFHLAVSLGVAIAAALFTYFLFTRVLGRRMNLFKKFILNDTTDSKKGYVSNKTRSDLIGQTGVAMTTLRPAGTAVFGEERIDVVTEGSFIAKDKKVKVIKAEGSRVVVREIETN
ncbi:NfeD family protein [Metabacillus sp. RGM 3146]|uniref:NfeD family protein n=1 Tax=Metabacillus sp. RGM 3146 TaxID=3401092 RepID=UPI003B99DC6E